jgi:3-oxoacyl-[acyl-carrier protein] reductase
MELDLSGKRAWVCAASAGIGRATAHALAGQGAAVTLIGRDPERTEGVRKELAGPEGEHRTLIVDLWDPEAVRKALEEHPEESPVPSILVTNNGGPPGGKAFDAESQAYEEAFGAHLLVPHSLVQHVVPRMREAGYGRIVNVISTSVKQPIPNLGVSNTVRGAMANWAKTLAGELGPDGITVNNVLPGFTNTARLDGIIKKRAEEGGGSEEEVREWMMASVPLRRPAEPTETADAIAFLASPSAAYISGVNLPVDGGRTGSL